MLAMYLCCLRPCDKGISSGYDPDDGFSEADGAMCNYVLVKHGMHHSQVDFDCEGGKQVGGCHG